MGRENNLRGAVREKCIVDGIGGLGHDYPYCIKPLEQMLDQNKMNRSGPFNYAGIVEAGSGLIRYAESLIKNKKGGAGAISTDCKQLIGNKYFIKSRIKCKNMDKKVHSYINNVVDRDIFTGRRKAGEDPGLLPATLSSALNINVGAFFSALTEDPNQDCIEVELPCHILHGPKGNYTLYKYPENDSEDLSSPSGGIKAPITVKQYDKLVENGDLIPTAQNRRDRELLDSQSGFENLYESINNYLDKNPEILNNNDNDSIKNIDENSSDEIIFNLYYLMISIFILFLVFKLMYKK